MKNIKYLLSTILTTIFILFINIGVNSQEDLRQQVIDLGIPFNPVALRSQATPDVPPWVNDIIIWSKDGESEKEWRNHPDLRNRFHPQYPDDLEVIFSDNETGKHEVMWVRVIAMHAPSGEFLGFLLNEPYHIKNLKSGDNVVFRSVQKATHPVAINFGNGFEYAGLPTFSPPIFSQWIVRGLNHYRQGNFGHNQAELNNAISAFHTAEREITELTSAESKFFLHFYLARCYAEKYETLKAVSEFETALQFRPKDENVHMGLLAEYSILAVSQNDDTEAINTNQWIDKFNDQEKTIRNIFNTQSMAVVYLDTILRDIRSKDGGSPQMGIAGNATFRWKVK